MSGGNYNNYLVWRYQIEVILEAFTKYTTFFWKIQLDICCSEFFEKKKFNKKKERKTFSVVCLEQLDPWIYVVHSFGKIKAERVVALIKLYNFLYWELTVVLLSTKKKKSWQLCCAAVKKERSGLAV